MLCCSEFTSQEFGFGLPSFHSDHSESAVEPAGATRLEKEIFVGEVVAGISGKVP